MINSILLVWTYFFEFYECIFPVFNSIFPPANCCRFKDEISVADCGDAIRAEKV